MLEKELKIQKTPTKPQQSISVQHIHGEEMDDL